MRNIHLFVVVDSGLPMLQLSFNLLIGGKLVCLLVLFNEVSFPDLVIRTEPSLVSFPDLVIRTEPSLELDQYIICYVASNEVYKEVFLGCVVDNYIYSC